MSKIKDTRVTVHKCTKMSYFPVLLFTATTPISNRSVSRRVALTQGKFMMLFVYNCYRRPYTKTRCELNKGKYVKHKYTNIWRDWWITKAIDVIISVYFIRWEAHDNETVIKAHKISSWEYNKTYDIQTWVHQFTEPRACQLWLMWTGTQ